MAAAEFPAAFRSLEEDFVESKMAINNSVADLLRNDGARALCRQSGVSTSAANC